MQRTGEINENELEEGSADTPSRPKLQRDSTIDVTVKVNPSFYCEKRCDIFMMPELSSCVFDLLPCQRKSEET